ncbi:MAG: hypothetical protein ACK5QT_04500 [Oligoflexia bacterium]
MTSKNSSEILSKITSQATATITLVLRCITDRKGVRRAVAAGVAVAVGLGVASLAGCEFNGTDFPSRSECASNSAAIAITDGLIARLCGCAEGGGGWKTFDVGIECTVPAGTTVVFNYVATQLLHQVVSTSSSPDLFSASPVSDPAQDPVIRAHAVQLQTGTYQFTDTYDLRLNSRITVL